MLICPKCTSSNVVPGKLIKDEHMAKAMNFAQAAQQFGGKRVSILAGLGALAMKGVNALCRDYRCENCGHTFDVEGGHGEAVH